MKLISFFLINIIFSNAISEWIDLNNHILNSKSCKISFKQEQEAIIGGAVHYNSDIGSLMYLNDNIRYESNDRIMILNKDSLKMLNKYTNQIFIDYSNEKYESLLSINPADFLLDSNFIDSNIDYYYIKFDDTTEIKIYFTQNDMIVFEVLYNDIKIRLLDIKLSVIDKTDVANYLKIKDSASEIFDLRIK